MKSIDILSTFTAFVVGLTTYASFYPMAAEKYGDTYGHVIGIVLGIVSQRVESIGYFIPIIHPVVVRVGDVRVGACGDFCVVVETVAVAVRVVGIGVQRELLEVG